MPRPVPVPQHPESPRPECDSRIRPHQLVALNVIGKALADAQSRAHGRHEGEWRQDAREFLTAPERAADLQFWTAVLDVPLDQMRCLIVKALNGHAGGRNARNRPDFIGETADADGTIGVSGRAGTRTRHP